MRGKKWEDLDYDCLVNILGRVGMESLLLHVPFVCKSWYNASLNSSYWEHISFPFLEEPFSQFVDKFIAKYKLKHFSVSAFVRLIIHRGLSKSTSLALPGYGDELAFAAEKCPNLKSLSLKWCFLYRHNLPTLIGKWRLLEELTLDYPENLSKIVVQIGQNCSNFNSLAVCTSIIKKNDALAISNHLQKLKKLSLIHCCIEQKNLEIIIQNCRELELLDVSKCELVGIWEEKKLKTMSLHIKSCRLGSYKCSGGECYYSDFGEMSEQIKVTKEVIIEPEWENMEFNCMVNILGRVGLESLLMNVPFVCKSWYEASLDSSCWQHIDLEDLFENPYKKIDRFEELYRVKKFTYVGVLRLIIALGCGKATSLVLPRRSSHEFLELAAEKCPLLRSFSSNKYAYFGCPNLIGRWNLLEELRLDGYCSNSLLEIAAEIGENCTNFKSLALYDSKITEEVALAIGKHLQKLKKLSLLHCDVEQEDLVFIILGCTDLELLDLNNCKYSGFWYGWNLRVTKTLNLVVSSNSLDVNYDESEYVHMDFDDSFFDSDADSSSF